MWIVVNVGCIECGVSSNIVVVVREKAEADAIAKECHEHFHWREGGQNDFEVFEVPAIGVIHPEYREKLTPIQPTT